MATSVELHPVSGARFVCERVSDEYAFAVYMAGGVTHTGALRWDAEGRVEVAPPVADAWAQAELIKLARVLKHSKQDRLTRWRGP